jgi:hypothetical protein
MRKDSLFTPLQLGAIQLPNRIIMGHSAGEINTLHCVMRSVLDVRRMLVFRATPSLVGSHRHTKGANELDESNDLTAASSPVQLGRTWSRQLSGTSTSSAAG